MVISLVPRASPSSVLDHFPYTNDMSRGSFRKIVKKGQKLTVKKLGGYHLVLLSHLLQCSQGPGEGGGGVGGEILAKRDKCLTPK